MIAFNLRKVENLIAQERLSWLMISHYNYKAQFISRISLQQVYCLVCYKGIMRMFCIWYELNEFTLFRLDERCKFYRLINAKAILCSGRCTSSVLVCLLRAGTVLGWEKEGWKKTVESLNSPKLLNSYQDLAVLRAFKFITSKWLSANSILLFFKKV